MEALIAIGIILILVGFCWFTSFKETKKPRKKTKK
jgi:hypothetical protein